MPLLGSCENLGSGEADSGRDNGERRRLVPMLETPGLPRNYCSIKSLQAAAQDSSLVFYHKQDVSHRLSRYTLRFRNRFEGFSERISITRFD